MTCKHGLEEINCPICRVTSETVPKFNSKIHELYQNELKPINPHLEKSTQKKKEFNKDLKATNVHKEKTFSHNFPNLGQNLNPIPDFKNRMFQERMDEIDITKSKKYEYLKKKEIFNPVFKFLNKEE